MPAFDTLQDATFAGFRFPVSAIDVTGGLRDHVHEFPHSPGGAPEKLGRKLYEFTFTCPFHNTFRRWPKLWPETLASLRIIFEGGRTFDLVVPTIGTIPAYCVSWKERADMRHRSGVEVEMSFREDQSNLFLVESLITVAARDLSAVVASLDSAVEESDLDPDIFESLDNMVEEIASFGDAIELQADLLDQKLQRVESHIRTLEDTFDDLGQPKNWPVLYQLHNLAVAAIDARADVAKKSVPVVTYLTPRLMSVSEVSIAQYGRTDRASEIMRMNALPDPFAIQPKTPLRVYAS